jgi:hypothetical protein
VYLRTDKTLIRNSLYVLDRWEKNSSHKKTQYNYSKEMSTGRAKPIRIIGDPDNQRPDKRSATIFVKRVE